MSQPRAVPQRPGERWQAQSADVAAVKREISERRASPKRGGKGAWDAARPGIQKERDVDDRRIMTLQTQTIRKQAAITRRSPTVLAQGGEKTGRDICENEAQ